MRNEETNRYVGTPGGLAETCPLGDEWERIDARAIVCGSVTVVTPGVPC
jgi:hypothetical protein